MLDGIRNRAGQGAEVRYAPGIRPAHRTFRVVETWKGDLHPGDLLTLPGMGALASGKVSKDGSITST